MQKEVVYYTFLGLLCSFNTNGLKEFQKDKSAKLLLGLYNSLWALILPGSISVYNTIIVKTAMDGVPDSLTEAAHIDGANDILILFRIIIPLIIPTLAVIVLYYAVSHWNSWFSALIYLEDNNKLPIQAVMRAILIENNEILSSDNVTEDGTYNSFAETIKYSLIIVGTLPILVLYPFLQKYFVKDVMIGAVKGWIVPHMSIFHLKNY